MLLTKFLEQNLIKYCYVRKGTKTDRRGKTTNIVKPSSTVFNTTYYTQFKKPKELGNSIIRGISYNFTEGYLASDTTAIARIDIDYGDIWNAQEDNLCKKIKKSPYYLSRNKKLPHYFVEITDLPKDHKKYYKFQINNKLIGEVFTGQWTWANIDATVKNSNHKIQKIKFNNLKQFLKIQEAQPQKIIAKNVNYPNSAYIFPEFHESKQQIQLTLFRIHSVYFYMKCISLRKLTDHSSWTKIGFALKADCNHMKNILNKYTNTDDIIEQIEPYYYALWNGFSAKAHNYNEEAVKNLWEKGNPTSKHSFATIQYYAKENKELYPHVKDIDIGCSSGHVVELGELLKRKINEFRFISKDKYLVCNNNLWKEINNNGDFYKKLSNWKSYLLKDTPSELDIMYKPNPIIEDILLAKSSSTKLVKCLIEQMYDHDILSKLNDNPDIFPLKDCKYILSTGTFEEYKPEDFISQTSKYTRNEIEKASTEKITKFFEDIFPNEANRNYYINLFSELLYGQNTKEIFIVFSGMGANGKSLIANYLYEAFGTLMTSIPVEMLTDKKIGPGAANPYLGSSRYSRIITFSEPQEGSKVNNALIKELTGNDIIKTRNLYSQPFEFTPKFTPIVLCNTCFKLQDSSDHAMARRLIYIKFNVNFKKNPKPNNPFEKKIDYSLKSRESLQIYGLQLLKLLMNRYEILKQKDFKYKVPKEVLINKKELLGECDIVQQYINQNIVKTNNVQDYITYKELYEQYNLFCNLAGEFVGRQSVVKPRFIKKLENFHSKKKINGNNKYSVFTHCKFRDDGNEDNDYMF